MSEEERHSLARAIRRLLSFPLHGIPLEALDTDGLERAAELARHDTAYTDAKIDLENEVRRRRVEASASGKITHHREPWTSADNVRAVWRRWERLTAPRRILLRDGTHATVYAYESVEEIDRRGVSKSEREYQRRGLLLHVERPEKGVVNELMTELSTSYVMTALHVAPLRNEIETDLAVSRAPAAVIIAKINEATTVHAEAAAKITREWALHRARTVRCKNPRCARRVSKTSASEYCEPACKLAAWKERRRAARGANQQ